MPRRNGQFKIFAVETIDQGIALLTGVAAGQRDAEGRYPADSVNGRVEARLNRFAQQLQRKPASGCRGR